MLPPEGVPFHWKYPRVDPILWALAVTQELPLSFCTPWSPPTLFLLSLSHPWPEALLGVVV